MQNHSGIHHGHIEPLALDDIGFDLPTRSGWIRRGIAELDGEGEVAGGIVVMRSGGNARATIDAVDADVVVIGATKDATLISEDDKKALQDGMREAFDHLMHGFGERGDDAFRELRFRSRKTPVE